MLLEIHPVQLLLGMPCISDVAPVEFPSIQIAPGITLLP